VPLDDDPCNIEDADLEEFPEQNPKTSSPDMAKIKILAEKSLKRRKGILCTDEEAGKNLAAALKELQGTDLADKIRAILRWHKEQPIPLRIITGVGVFVIATAGTAVVLVHHAALQPVFQVIKSAKIVGSAAHTVYQVGDDATQQKETSGRRKLRVTAGQNLLVQLRNEKLVSNDNEQRMWDMVANLMSLEQRLAINQAKKIEDENKRGR